jgi:hypothetical protein
MDQFYENHNRPSANNMQLESSFEILHIYYTFRWEESLCVFALLEIE